MASKTQDQIERERAINEQRRQGAGSSSGGQTSNSGLPAIGDIRYQTGEVNPYKGRSKTIKKTYGGYETAYNNQQKNIYNQSVAEANKSAENAHRQQYISYMQNRRDLPNMLAQQGMNGGVGETSRLNLTTNYQNNRNATDAQRAAQIQSYRDAMNNNIATFQQTNQQAMQAALDENRDKYNTWNSADLDKQKQIYSETISGYNNADEIRKEIARIRKSGKDTWRIAYLQTRLTALEELAAEEAASGSSGGSGGGRGGSGGGGGGDDGAPTTDDPSSGGGLLTGAVGKIGNTSGSSNGGGKTNKGGSGNRYRPYERAPFGAQYYQQEPYGTGYGNANPPRVRIPKLSYGNTSVNSRLRRGTR